MKKLLDELHGLMFRFDALSLKRRIAILKALKKADLPSGKTLVLLNDCLIFLRAHSAGKAELALCLSLSNRLASHLRRMEKKEIGTLSGTGLPFVSTCTQFTTEYLRWLQRNTDCTILFDSFYQPRHQLSEVLAVTLQPFERDRIDGDGVALLRSLGIQGDPISFLLDEVEQFADRPVVKDYLFDGLGVYVNVLPRSARFSRLENRYDDGSSPVFFNELQRYADLNELLQKPLPSPAPLSSDLHKQLSDVIRASMALLSRETDPATYMEPASLRYYILDRGISIAVYGMTESRQLPFESYIGYTLFRNGYPAAYGGAWIFGKRALFGINIFEWFRGGESGTILGELLRVYRQVFGTTWFEVEPFQYGADNPDGIATGAFWYYYRYGFRPTDPALAELAKSEREKITARPGYRTSERTLIKFTGSGLALQLEKKEPPSVTYLTEAIAKVLDRKFKGDRKLAISQALRFSGLEESKFSRAAEEWYLVALANDATKPENVEQIGEIVHAKRHDEYAYQALVTRWLSGRKFRPGKS